jgi:hypothetical protein
MGENHFIATNFDTLPTVEILFIYHESFGIALSGHKIHPKKIIQNLPTLVVVVESFSLLPSLAASQRLNLFFSMKFLEQKPLYLNNIW